jgi:hypothetical protein
MNSIKGHAAPCPLPDPAVNFHVKVNEQHKGADMKLIWKKILAEKVSR